MPPPPPPLLLAPLEPRLPALEELEPADRERAERLLAAIAGAESSIDKTAHAIRVALALRR